MPSSAFGVPRRSATRYDQPPATILVSTLTANISATLSFTKFDSTNFYGYQCVMQDIVSASGGIDLCLEGSVDGGATYGALWNGSAGRFYPGFWDAWTSPSSSQFIRVGIQVTNATPVGLNGAFRLHFGKTLSQRSVIYGSSSGYSTNNYLMFYGGYYDSPLPINALRWSFTAGGGGNITSGTIAIYGLPKS